MRVLGIDPGLRLTGYACVEGDAAREAIVEAGVIRLVRGDRAGPIAPRLVELEGDVNDAIERTRPEVVAVEALFAHKAFPATAIAMGHARGVVLLCAARAGLGVVELPARLVKRAATGSGRASKEQMQLAVQRIFDLPAPPSPPDVADAIAIALCGLRRGASSVADSIDA